MKRLIAILALSTAFGVAACDDPNDYESEVAEAPMDAPVAPAAEDVGAPVAAPPTEPAAALDTAALPPLLRWLDRALSR